MTFIHFIYLNNLFSVEFLTITDCLFNTVTQRGEGSEHCVRPEHWFEDGLQGDFQVQLVGAGELHIDGLISGDDVPRVVHALDPHGVRVHDVSAV